MIELYTWRTPNGRKASIMLEEIGLPYNGSHGEPRQERAVRPGVPENFSEQQDPGHYRSGRARRPLIGLRERGDPHLSRGEDRAPARERRRRNYKALESHPAGPSAATCCKGRAVERRGRRDLSRCGGGEREGPGPRICVRLMCTPARRNGSIRPPRSMISSTPG